MSQFLFRLIGLVLTSFVLGLYAKAAEAKTFQGIQDIIRQIEPGVVHIRSKDRPLRRTNTSDPYSFFFQTAPAQNSSSFPLGTGFLIRPLGYCVTSFQNVEGLHNFEIITSKKRRLIAEYVGGDRQNDLALLRIKDSKGLNPLEFGDSNQIEVGDPAFALGFPLGFKTIVSSGLVAALGGVMGAGPFDGHLVLDFSSNASNSGAPLVDSRGRVLGLLSAVPGAPSQLGFALPAKLLQSLVEDLIKFGKLRRPWLGLVVKNMVSIDSVTELYDPKLRAGIIVNNLIVEGPAAHASLQVGDLILGIGNQKVENIHDLQAFLRHAKPSEKVTIEVYRRRQGLLKIPIVLGEIPGAEDLPQEEDLY